MRTAGIAGVVVMWGCTAAAAQAGLVWEQRTIEKQAPVGAAQVIAGFAFTNDGKEPLTITRVDVPCGCTVAGLRLLKPEARAKADAPPEPSAAAVSAAQTSAELVSAPLVVPAGARGEVQVTFTLGDRVGDHSKPVTVRWCEGDASAVSKIGNEEGADDKLSSPGELSTTSATPAAPEQVNTLSFKVVAPEVLKMSPRLVYWRAGEARKPKAVDVIVGIKDAVAITAVSTSDERIAARVEELEAGHHYQVWLTPPPEEIREAVRAAITLRTDCKDVPADRFRVFARLMPSSKPNGG